MQVDGWALPCLFVYGHMSTGKTTTIKHVLQRVINLIFKNIKHSLAASKGHKTVVCVCVKHGLHEVYVQYFAISCSLQFAIYLPLANLQV